MNPIQNSLFIGDLTQIHHNIPICILYSQSVIVREAIKWKMRKKFWEKLIADFPLIRHGPHKNRRVQQFFYCCMCICCRGNVFTESLPSNDRGIHIKTHRLIRKIYEMRRWDGLSAKIFLSLIRIGSGIKNWLWWIHRHTDNMVVL
jgi:hypothetical protein